MSLKAGLRQRKTSNPSLAKGWFTPPPQLPSDASQAAAWLQRMRQAVAQSEDVGERFTEEARKMHWGEADQRPIRGQANIDQTLQLLEEGIPVLPLPPALKEPLQ